MNSKRLQGYRGLVETARCNLWTDKDGVTINAYNTNLKNCCDAILDLLARLEIANTALWELRRVCSPIQKLHINTALSKINSEEPVV